MKNRFFVGTMALVMSVSMLLPGLSPVYAASEPASAPLAAANYVDAYTVAGIEFTTPAGFSIDGDAVLSPGYGMVNYFTGNGLYFYDQNGNPIFSTMYSSAFLITDHLMLVKNRDSEKYAIYRDRAPLTDAIYKGYKIYGGCLVGIKDDGRDFFDMEGNVRTVGTLPSGWEPWYVTASGTVVARIRNTAISSSSGDKFYKFALLDREGNILVNSGFSARNDDEGEIYSFSDSELSIDSARYSCDGLKICPGSSIKLGENRYISKSSEVEGCSYCIYDKTGTLVKGVDANIQTIGDQVGNLFLFQNNTRWGLADVDGNIIEPAVNDIAFPIEAYPLYAAPEYKRVLVGKRNEKCVIYDGQGNLVLRLDGYISVSLKYDCIWAYTNNNEIDVFDLDGNAMGRFTPNGELKEINGVKFYKPQSSDHWYVIDCLGNRISEMDFSSISSSSLDLIYGLANVYQNGFYVVNSAGEVLNSQKMDEPLRMYPPDSVYKPKPENVLGVYTQNGKAGICRYVPAVGRCPNTQNGKHDFQITAQLAAPTCTEPGKSTQRCSACGVETVRPIPALGHAWQLTETLTEGESLHGSSGLYTCSRCQQTKEAPLCAAEVFIDMPAEDHWAHNAIDWAYFNGYTSGTSATTFSPDATLTRGQVVTFLYAFRGKPETEAENPFRDVSETDYYYRPVLWAVANGITRGMDETHFAPADSCVRAQIVTFLWAAAGHPEPEGTENPFEDVTETDYFYKPVLWAVENGITRGMDATHFGPTVSCTRAQMVTFLKAASAAVMEKPEDPEPTDPTDPIDPEDPADPTEPEKPTELIIPAV